MSAAKPLPVPAHEQAAAERYMNEPGISGEETLRRAAILRGEGPKVDLPAATDATPSAHSPALRNAVWPLPQDPAERARWIEARRRDAENEAACDAGSEDAYREMQRGHDRHAERAKRGHR